MSRLAAPRIARFAVLLLAATASPVLAPPARAGDPVGPPKIRSVTPASAPRGSTVDVTIEGTNLYPVDDVIVSIADIGAALQPGNGDHKLVVRLTIPDSANPGPVTITVKTKEGAVRTEKFSVRLRLPTVTKINPTAVHRGATTEMTLTGTQLAFSGFDTKVTTDAGIVVERLPKSTATSLLLKVTAPMTAPAGPHTFVVETVDGKVNVPFAVLLSPPTLASATPAVVARGTSAVLALVGTNLLGAAPPTLAVPDSDVRLEAAGEPTMTALSVTATAARDAAIGPRLLVLQTADGVATVRFSVVGTPPRALKVQPPGAARGTTVEATLSGEAVPADAIDTEWRFVPADPAVRLERTAGGGWKIAVAPDARPGPRTLVATTRDGAAAVPFHVGLRPPAVAGITPADLAPGADVNLAVEGQNLQGATLSLADAGDGLESEPTPAIRRAIHVKVAADARPGPRVLLVRGPDGAAIGRFSVTGPAASAPVLESGTPGRVPRGRATKVVLSGLNLMPAGGKAPEVTARGAEDAALPVQVLSASASRIEVEVSPPAGAALGGGVILVKTSDGTAAVALSVDPSLPSIASASPQVLPRPGDTEITLVGEGLAGPGGAAPRVSLVPALGHVALPATVVSHGVDRVVVKASLPYTATPGTWLVVLETDEGGAAATVTVEGAAPVITSIEPRSLGVPATIDVVVRGQNLVEPNGKAPRVISITRVGASSPVQITTLKVSPEALALQVTTPANALGGPHFLVVKTADGSAAILLDIVNSPPPVVLGIDAAEAVRFSNVMTTIRGTGLLGATAVLFEGEGVAATILPGGNEKELLVRISVGKDAAVGVRGFRVVAPGGVSRGGDKAFFSVK